MVDKTSIQQRAKAMGIADAYWDVDGHYHEIDTQILNYFIAALTLPEETKEATDTFDAVHVIPAGSPQTLALGDTINRYVIYDEAQQVVQKACQTVDELAVPALSAGYYTLLLIGKQLRQRWRLLVAPSRCYYPDTLKQRQLCGLTLQLYSLRSISSDALRANWGIGDFADLHDAVTLAAKQGWDFVGLNPMHALYPQQPQWFSPYSPSSRIYLHWIYLSIGMIPEFYCSADNRAWLDLQQAQLRRLRQAEYVDYIAVSRLKMQALRRAFAHFTQHGERQRQSDFAAFVNAGGEALRLNAAFYAIGEVCTDADVQDNLGYENFPPELQNAASPAVQRFIREHPLEIQFFSYLQWLLEEQLGSVQQHCRDSGLNLGLYGDLAVGVARGSADQWSNPDLYRLQATIGAPPDPLGPIGQNWDLPPMHPAVLEKQGFVPFVNMLRANMKHCGALRIDHVMSLYRLWLIPTGKTAADGAYVHYPFTTLMAILAIESQRAQCVVIGEDLGTVPDEVRECLERYDVLSYDVFYFAGHRPADGQRRWRHPAEVKNKALSVIGTHDLPPLAGWWHCSDLHLLGKLGILSPAALTAKFDARLRDKQALLNALKLDGYLPENYHIDALTMAMHPRLNRAIHAYVKDARTCLFGIQPENFCAVEQAFNVPGTTTAVRNWQRKLPYPLESINMCFDSNH